jgi:hypothetical protein
MAVKSSSQVKTEQAGQSKDTGGKGLRFGSLLPYAVAVLVLIIYFVWMCIEMSTQAPGGGAVPLSIFGAVLLGVAAGGLSMIKSRRDD